MMRSEAILTHLSARLETPEAMKGKLLEHQKAALCRCVQLEQNSIVFIGTEDRSVSSDVGYLTDLPGTGKTYLALAICLSNHQMKATPINPKHTSLSVFPESDNSFADTDLTYVDITVIVVHADKFEHWANVAGDVVPAHLLHMYSISGPEKSGDITKLPKGTIVIVKSTHVERVHTALSTSWIKRLIIDDYRNIVLRPGVHKRIHSGYTWLVYAWAHMPQRPNQRYNVRYYTSSYDLYLASLSSGGGGFKSSPRKEMDPLVMKNFDIRIVRCCRLLVRISTKAPPVETLTHRFDECCTLTGATSKRFLAMVPYRVSECASKEAIADLPGSFNTFKEVLDIESARGFLLGRLGITRNEIDQVMGTLDSLEKFIELRATVLETDISCIDAVNKAIVALKQHVDTNVDDLRRVYGLCKPFMSAIVKNVSATSRECDFGVEVSAEALAEVREIICSDVKEFEALAQTHTERLTTNSACSLCLTDLEPTDTRYMIPCCGCTLCPGCTDRYSLTSIYSCPCCRTENYTFNQCNNRYIIKTIESPRTNIFKQLFRLFNKDSRVVFLGVQNWRGGYSEDEAWSDINDAGLKQVSLAGIDQYVRGEAQVLHATWDCDLKVTDLSFTTDIVYHKHIHCPQFDWPLFWAVNRPGRKTTLRVFEFER